MNGEVLARLLRTFLQMLGVWVASQGYMTGGHWEIVTGAIVAVATTLYTVWTSWGTTKVPVADLPPSLKP